MKTKKTINVEIGMRIQDARISANLTQEEFAERIDIGAKSVSALERGVVGISLSTMKRICRVLSVSSDTLLFGPATGNNTADLVAQLERLTPEQFEIARGVFDKLMEAFALSDKEQ